MTLLHLFSIRIRISIPHSHLTILTITHHKTSSAILTAIQPSQTPPKKKEQKRKKKRERKEKISQSCPKPSAPSSPSTPSTKLKPTGSPPAGTVAKDFVITGTCVSNPHATSTSVLRVLRNRPAVAFAIVVVMVMGIGIGIVMVKVGGGELVVGDGIERKLKRRGFVMREFRGGCD